MINNSGAQGDAGTGSVVGLWETGRWLIENNLIELLPNKMGWGLRYGILMRIYEFGDSEFEPLDPRVFRQLVIRNNMIRNADGLPDSDGLNTGISLGYCENPLVEHNIIDLEIGDPIVASACTNLRFFNNRNSAGQLVQGVVGTTRQDELTAFIEDVAIRAML